MSPEELKEYVESLKKEGKSDEEIAKAFLGLYIDKKVDLEDLKTLLAAVGFDINPEIEEILKNNPESIGLDKDNKDDSKPEDKKDEDKPEDKSDKKDEPKDEDKSEKSEDEESDWKEAKKYFHLKD